LDRYTNQNPHPLLTAEREKTRQKWKLTRFMTRFNMEIDKIYNKI